MFEKIFQNIFKCCFHSKNLETYSLEGLSKKVIKIYDLGKYDLLYVEVTESSNSF